MRNLIIIGNGFDLAHGLKTGYIDFLKKLFNEHFDKNTHNELFTIINKRSINNFETFVKKINESDIRKNSSLFYELIKDIRATNWCDVEKRYFKEVLKILRIKDGPLNYSSRISSLNKEFDEIRNKLIEYLIEEEMKIQSIDIYSDLLNKLVTNNSCILNFNYTNTLSKYLDSNTRNIINIHGELNNPENPIIFGFAANNEESRQLIDKDDKEFLRYIKKHCYKRTYNEVRLSNFLEKGDGIDNKIDVYILGHSCGISDKLILNDIFNHKSIRYIRVFHHKDDEHYFETQVNIDRIMNNDENFKRLKPYSVYRRMPQHDDIPDLHEKFKKYIDKIEVPFIPPPVMFTTM